MIAVKPVKRKPLSVDIGGHHALCEMNFHQLISLLPGIRKGVEHWSFAAGRDDLAFDVKMSVVETARYTSTIKIEQNHQNLETPCIVVRLYHDVNMAEIISWDNHRYWLPEYSYPNKKMYHPDEKLALNKFLNEWLSFCRKLGLQKSKTVMQFSQNANNNALFETLKSKL
ncbi:DUF1249 domain-containing protein [Agarilytica rhodophyticola]|uniref:DUF1249 domain-containing protein n=1 Tax=Agarilytica rhodophyticola TaxID=1737490 RepID=UPI001FE422D3|nr:DUF1249 domain-containing protein [Agarilytica rhodophyticola]